MRMIFFILTNEEEKGGEGFNDENPSSYVFDCEDDNNNNNEQPQSPMERAIYWESREDLFQVCMFIKFYKNNSSYC